MNNSANKGQALLIILLVMAVVLTIGLSVASRSSTDIRISQQTEESARAFSAAEAGIESALVGGNMAYSFPETGATYEARSTEFGSGNSFAFPSEYGTDETMTLWLANHETYAQSYNYNKIRILWGKANQAIDQNSPALEISIYYKDGTDYKVGRFAFDPVSAAVRGHDNKFCRPDGTNCQNIDTGSFTTTGESVGGKNFHFGVTLNLSSARMQGGAKVLLFARLRLIYSTTDQFLGAKKPDAAGGTGTLPAQGLRVESVGQAGSSTRKVEVSRLFPAPPSIFDFVLYSGGSLSK